MASMVDATAGGIMDAPTNPWIYLRFTPEGLRKVEVDDLQALESTDWDIAAKRFGLDIVDTRAKLGIYTRTGLLSMGDGYGVPQLGNDDDSNNSRK